MNMNSEQFYESIVKYHIKTDAIQRLVSDYFKAVGRKYQKRFVAVKIKDFFVEKSTEELSETIQESINIWFRKEDKDEIFESIYKIEVPDEVYLFKFFDFGEGEAILAGYVLLETVSVRAFLASLGVRQIEQKYEKILSIL